MTGLTSWNEMRARVRLLYNKLSPGRVSLNPCARDLPQERPGRRRFPPTGLVISAVMNMARGARQEGRNKFGGVA